MICTPRKANFQRKYPFGAEPKSTGTRITRGNFLPSAQIRCSMNSQLLVERNTAQSSMSSFFRILRICFFVLSRGLRGFMYSLNFWGLSGAASGSDSSSSSSEDTSLTILSGAVLSWDSYSPCFKSAVFGSTGRCMIGEISWALSVLSFAGFDSFLVSTLGFFTFHGFWGLDTLDGDLECFEETFEWDWDEALLFDTASWSCGSLGSTWVLTSSFDSTSAMTWTVSKFLKCGFVLFRDSLNIWISFSLCF